MWQVLCSVPTLAAPGVAAISCPQFMLVGSQAQRHDASTAAGLAGGGGLTELHFLPETSLILDTQEEATWPKQSQTEQSWEPGLPGVLGLPQVLPALGHVCPRGSMQSASPRKGRPGRSLEEPRRGAAVVWLSSFVALLAAVPEPRTPSHALASTVH